MIYNTTKIINTVKGNPVAMHTFNPVSLTNIVQVNKKVDGKTRKYFGYASNVRGSEINLYYTNDISKEWTPYSNNPILVNETPIFRWPSTVYIDGTFHMFLDNNFNSRLEHWTSTDGVNFTFSEILHNENTNGGGNYNPFIWLNPNDNKWYLYWRNSTTHEIMVNVSEDINKFATTCNKVVINSKVAYPSLTASPSVMFYDGKYYLLMEGFLNKIWKTYLFESTSPVGGFSFVKEILNNNEACCMQYFDENNSNLYLYVSRLCERGWIEETHLVTIK